jgi:methyl-accepting chemotaxis protein
MGYSLGDIKGKHHSIFISADESSSVEYKTFWQELKQGKYHAAQYRRLGKAGKQVWIEASYNPIFDMNGEVLKIVKFATDITYNIQHTTSTVWLVISGGQRNG